MDGMHMIERKQDALNGAMLRALMAEHLREEREKVQHEPIQDASFSALASRIVDDAKSGKTHKSCLLYTSPSPRDRQKSRMPSSA